MLDAPPISGIDSAPPDAKNGPYLAAPFAPGWERAACFTAAHVTADPV